MNDGPLEALGLASLSGKSNAKWVSDRKNWIDFAFLGGLALDSPTRKAARRMVERGRDEFLTRNPNGWIREQFTRIGDIGVKPGINVRTSSTESLSRVADTVSDLDGILEINAHCRQKEMIQAGCGHALLRDPTRLWEYLQACKKEDVQLSLKVRFEVENVDVVSLLNRAAKNGIDYLHVDTMDSSERLRYVNSEAKIIANNGIRSIEDVEEMIQYGADMVSVARGDDPGVLRKLRTGIISGRSTAAPKFSIDRL